MEVYFTREIPEIAEILLKKKDIKTVVFRKNNPISKDTLIRNIRNSDGLISLLSDKIDKNVIDAMPKCRIIANYAVGFNNIDVDYAKSKGIIVTNTPDVLTESTAEITMALTLACSRRILEGQEMMINNKFKGWEPKLLLGIELTGKYFGIIGSVAWTSCGSKVAINMWESRNPAGAASTCDKPRYSCVAMTSRNKLPATCATTRAFLPRKRRCDVTVLPPAFNAVAISARVALMAGASPKNRALASAAPKLYRSTRVSMRALISRGICAGIRQCENCSTNHSARRTAAAPAARAIRTLSASSCRTNCQRPAPMARRTAISPERARPRLRVRLATLAQAITSTTAASISSILTSIASPID